MFTVQSLPPVETKSFKWASELNAQSEGATWVWKGYIPRAGIVLLSALWKAGKSTLLTHLIKSFDGSKAEFLGQEIVPSRVLLISEEDESILAKRRDELNIGDHWGSITRPFKCRPTVAEWRAFVDTVVTEVKAFHFDVVIVDTLSKMWPVREENNAGQVEEALMPLWKITNEGAAVVLVHHLRKSESNQFVGARGSGGLSAFGEVLIEFRRNNKNDLKDRKRRISAVGRYDEIPEERLIELTGGEYICHGDPDQPEVRAATKTFHWAEAAMEIIRDAGRNGITQKEILESLKDQIGTSVYLNDFVAWLKKKVNDVEIVKTGQKKPYLYLLA